MFISFINLQNIKKSLIFVLILLCILAITYFSIRTKSNNKLNISEYTEFYNEISEESLNSIIDYAQNELDEKKSYIKWVEFKATATTLLKLSNLDISSHINNEQIKFNWIELMAYLGCKYGGDLTKFKQKDLDNLINNLKSGISIKELTKNMKLYNYFFESYDAIFHEYIGEYTIQKKNNDGELYYETSYGLKVFSPIAKNYSFSHYKDFGTSRSYGYKRTHLGNDLLRKYWYSNNCSRIWIH